MSVVPPPPPPRKFVSKMAQQPTEAQQLQLHSAPRAEDDAAPPPPASTIPAGWTSPKAAQLAPPPSSIMKHRKASPLLGPASPSSSGGAVGPVTGLGTLSPPLAAEAPIKQQLMMEELLRENRNLQQRVARLLDSSVASLETAVDAKMDERRRAAGAREKSSGDSTEPGDTVLRTIDAVADVLDESSPPTLLLARIRRLELALQLECMERDDVETKCGVQQRLIAYLLKKVQHQQ